MTIYKASPNFDESLKLPDTQETEYYDSESSSLPKDGLPRISKEGMEILIEGLQGDFSRWSWGIGNHPLHIPYTHTQNVIIDAMKDRPHFIAKFWFGENYPQVNYCVMVPWFCFDEVDTYTLREEEINRIHLRQSTDCWASATLQIDDCNIWTQRDKNRFVKGSKYNYEESEDEEEASEVQQCQIDTKQQKLEVFF